MPSRVKTRFLIGDIPAGSFDSLALYLQTPSVLSAPHATTAIAIIANVIVQTFFIFTFLPDRNRACCRNYCEKGGRQLKELRKPVTG
jgi:hypothetical protein